MPELPDVEVFRRYLDATALHQRIDDVAVPGPDLLEGVSAATLRERLRGHALERTVRHGKYLFAGLDGEGGWLILHFGMTGQLQYYKGRYEAEDAQDGMPRHTRVRLDFENGYHLSYRNVRKLGRVGLTADKQGYVAEKGLGPDALEGGLTPEGFRERLAAHSATIKATLMDQGAIAGIGNEYSDEILFQARISPRRRADALDGAAYGRLYEATLQVLEAAIGARADPERMPADFLLPRREDGAACPRGCGGSVRKVKVSGRTGYHCPRCQPD